MSHFATPFIVINLGCEMIYVLDQRLQAQNITRDKSERVLTDVTSVLLHPKLLEELFTPQPIATHSVIKRLLQDIAASSIMKLDDYSSSKLWDLMTMIFKWQISTAINQNIFDITIRHIKSIAILMPQNFRNITDGAVKKFDALATRISDDDYNALIHTIKLWFSEYHTKISVLLRLGLQNKDGAFIQPACINQNIINNLGENIYKYDDKRNPIEEYENQWTGTNEINCLLAPIESHFPNKVKLSTTIQNNIAVVKSEILKNNEIYRKIDLDIRKNESNLTFNPELPKSPQEDLLKMMEKDD